jgi:hypothetical protein
VTLAVVTIAPELSLTDPEICWVVDCENAEEQDRTARKQKAVEAFMDPTPFRTFAVEKNNTQWLFESLHHSGTPGATSKTATELAGH